MLVRSGIVLLKYWLSVSDDEQERRFRARINDPLRRWKLSPMDIESYARWVDYSRAKDQMFKYTDIKQAPWYNVNADIKKHARLNVINHLLSMIPYKELEQDPFKMPERQDDIGYVRPPFEDLTFIPEVYPRAEDFSD
jgi:polyphosphate kinase 2 (PPK2 family)